MTELADRRGPLLPHRAPFLLLDTIVEVVPGTRARTEKLVSSADPLLRDGATSTEMLLLEAMAQCAGVAAASGREEPSGALVAVDRFQAHGVVVAGDRLALDASVVKKMGSMVKARVTVHVDGVLCAEGQLVIRLGTLPAGQG